MSTDLRLFTSESVTEGHPDKVCDQISDGILDAMLAQDPLARVAVETMVTTGLVHVAGEVTTEAYVEIPQVVRETLNRIGYTSSEIGFDAHSCGVSVSIGQQSADIAAGVDKAWEVRHDGVGVDDPIEAQGAGDQGLMFGYACDDTPSLMPLPIWIAHRLAERLAMVRKEGTLGYLRPDGKTQVTIGYDGDRAVRLDTVVVSTQHDPDVSLDAMLAPEIAEHVVAPVLEGLDLDAAGYRLLVNPTGPVRDRRPAGRRRRDRDARSSSTPTAGWRATAVARSPARTRRRWTGRPPTRCAGSRRTWWPRASPDAARCRWPTRSARRTRSGCTSRRSAPRRCRWTG